jgi:iron complex transport system substrate-binding protein
MLNRRHFTALLGSSALPSLAAAAPQRIVSIGGALTELIYALGAQAQLVGVDSTSLYPAAAQQLPNVGYARTLAAEGLLALAPTLIVATEEAGPPAVLRQLEAARVPLQRLPSDYRFEGLLERTRRLGELLGRQAEASALGERLAAQWQNSLQAVQRQRQNRPAPKVLFVMAQGLNQLRIAGQDTGADAMLAYAGASNALHNAKGYQTLTPEAAIAAAPDVILATEQGLAAAGGADSLLKVPGLALTPAGRAKRVVALETMELLGFGPRMPQALAKLSQALYV